MYRNTLTNLILQDLTFTEVYSSTNQTLLSYITINKKLTNKVHSQTCLLSRVLTGKINAKISIIHHDTTKVNSNIADLTSC